MLFLLYPEHEHFLDGKNRKLHTATYHMRVFTSLIGFLLPLALMIGAALWISSGIKSEERFMQESVITQGVVIRKYRENKTNFVLHRFTLDGKIYENSQTVNDTLFTSLEVDQPVSIRYSPDDPSISYIEGAEPDPNFYRLVLYLWSGMMILMMLFAMMSIYSAMHELEHRATLSKEGQLLDGSITDASSHRRNGTNSVTIWYSFSSPEGDLLTGKETYYGRYIEKDELPPEGTPVKVIYSSGKIYRLL